MTRNIHWTVRSACHACCAGLGLALLAPLSWGAAGAPPEPAACTGLAALKITDTTIATAAPIGANAPIQSPNPQFGGGVAPQPAHCLVRGEVGHHVGADGHPYGNRFEVRLPRQWSGRLVFQGGGGLDGMLMPAVGAASMDPRSSIPSALARGDAVVSTDGGHDQATLRAPGDFGADPQALADYEYNSTRVVMQAALAVTRAYYGRAVQHRYFLGCSNGGREGLIAAQRYPEFFDGVVAGSPAFHLTRAMVAEAWNVQAFAAIAPRTAGAPPNLAAALTDADLKLLADGVLAKCDALDGLKDGIISDPLACRFDPQVLACGTAPATRCLAPEKVAAIRKVFGGPKDSKGQSLYSDWIYDAGVAQPGWRLWMLGNAQMPALNVLIAPQAINGMALGLKRPPIDILKFNFDEDPQRIDPVAPLLNAESTDYRGFRSRGGKLLLYIGVSDPIFSARDLVRYFNEVQSANGGAQSTAQFARLFLVPGMNHCGGGSATDQFDALGAMQAWVEQGRAPERIVASGAAFPGRTRPLCAYPKVARYSGSKNPESADSFQCQ